MEVQKRKRIDDDNEDKEVKVTKEDDENKGTMVDDDEVEEFFAILKRIRVAKKYFDDKANTVGGGRKLTAEKPALLPEDFEGQECVVDNIDGC